MNCCLLDLFSFSQLKNKIWRFNFSAEDEKWTENAAWGRGKISRINLLCRRDESHEIWIKNEKQEQERERNNIKNYIQLIISKARLSCEADSRKYLVQFFDDSALPPLLLHNIQTSTNAVWNSYATWNTRFLVVRVMRRARILQTFWAPTTPRTIVVNNDNENGEICWWWREIRLSSFLSCCCCSPFMIFLINYLTMSGKRGNFPLLFVVCFSSSLMNIFLEE